MTETHTHTRTQWAVQFYGDPRYSDGYVSTGCTHPGSGLPVSYDEQLARMDGGGKNKVIRRTITEVITKTDWEEV